MTLLNTLNVICFTWLAFIFMSACNTATPIAHSPLPTPIPPTATPTTTNTPSPTPTQTPTVTPSPSSTATPPPMPMRTAAWTPTSLPTVMPYIQPAMTDLLPPLESDLLYLENGQLKWWNHATSQIKPLLEATDSLTNITQYVVGADNQNIFFSRVMTMPNYQIGQLNLKTLQITLLVNSAQPIMAWAISPDNQSIAYIIQGSQPSDETFERQFVPMLNPDFVKYQDIKINIQGILYVRDISSTKQRTEIAFITHIFSEKETYYSRGLNSLAWSSDSRTIFWGDGYGIWSGTLEQPTPKTKLLLPIKRSGRMEFHPIYSLGGVSPQGQYFVVNAPEYEYINYAIFDLANEFIIDIPDAYQAGGTPGTRFTWMNNGDLFAIRPGEMYGNNVTPPEPMVGEIRLIETFSQSSTLTRKAWFPIAAQPAPQNMPQSLTQFTDGHLGFMLTNEDNQNNLERGLYIVDMETLRPHKVNSLPPGSWLSAIWNPGASGAIIMQLYPENKPLLYAPTDGSALYDLSPIISPQACCFTWLKK